MGAGLCKEWGFIIGFVAWSDRVSSVISLQRCIALHVPSPPLDPAPASMRKSYIMQMQLQNQIVTYKFPQGVEHPHFYKLTGIYTKKWVTLFILPWGPCSNAFTE